jgi:hypothetical protein
MSMNNPKAGCWTLLVVLGSVFAIPVALFTTCTVRGPLPPPPYDPVGADIRHGMPSLCIGFSIGVLISAALVLTLIFTRKKKETEQPENKKLDG